MSPSLRKIRLILATSTAVTALVAFGSPAFADSTENEPTTMDGQTCEVSDILVNSCRPWLGARAAGYPRAGDSVLEQHLYHEQRIGRGLDIVHTFAPTGALPLANAEERALAVRADTYLFQNWKPASSWRSAAGGDATLNEHIDAAADNIKSVAPKQLFLTIHHEPENNVSSDAECQTKGASGTAEDYRAMWHNVRERFDAKQVDNVVWVMDYMNYSRWDCLVPKLYPGDSYVDWVMFNGYGDGAHPDFAANVDRFYRLLTQLSSPGMDVLSKPWGLAEWGISDATQEQAADYYVQAARALEQQRFPNLHSYVVFDSPGTHDDGGLRVGFGDDGICHFGEQTSYNTFANDPVFARTATAGWPPG
ncbi:MAG: glycosyl hydrolase [Stackebrandtia sp.]